MNDQKPQINCDPTKCMSMPQTELDLKFDHVIELLEKIDKKVEKIDERQQTHYKKLITHEKDIEFLKKEYEDNKANDKERNNRIWEEMRRRDKNVRWFVTVFVSIFAIIVSALNFFVQK